VPFNSTSFPDFSSAMLNELSKWESQPDRL
jgi:hypothetical protein